MINSLFGTYYIYMKNQVLLVLLVFAVFASFSCTSISSTGRSALQLIPDETLVNMSNKEFERLKSHSKLSNDEKYLAQVERVIERLSPFVPLPSGITQEDWEYILIEDDDLINAFALPGGKIGVYTGLFKIAKTDSDLAVVIAHEMAHVVAKHGGERMSQQLLALGGSIVLSQTTKGDTKEERERLMKIYGLGSSLGFLLPYSRLHENEADRLGLIYMAQAGYDPRVAIAFWERMEKEKSFHIPEFISTHPSSKTRIMELNSLMDEAMVYYYGY